MGNKEAVLAENENNEFKIKRNFFVASIKKGDLYEVERCLNLHPEFLQQDFLIDSYRKSALHLAVESNNYSMCKLFISRGIEVERQSLHFQTSFPIRCKTALFFAVENDNLEICQFLLENGANINRQYYQPFSKTFTIFDHIKAKSRNTWCWLLENGADSDFFLRNFDFSTKNLDFKNLINLLIYGGFNSIIINKSLTRITCSKIIFSILCFKI
eukprot:TRINITY_DN4019_c0_g1_i1.p1 TRINITY_DN4019_c0_g1~~TRINITY_DN4019_c0_g1_i1.p1  ORF type:complete len:227 (+),score=45.47 TRINITY_DN4019_c0_g1_i1:40-681(+)